MIETRHYEGGKKHCLKFQVMKTIRGEEKLATKNLRRGKDRKSGKVILFFLDIKVFMESRNISKHAMISSCSK